MTKFGLILGLLCMGAYIAFQPILSLHWELGSAETAASVSSGCQCCGATCTCASQKGGCRLVAKTKTLSVSIKGAACHRETEKSELTMPAIRWLLVPESQSFSCDLEWAPYAYDSGSESLLGKDIFVLKRPPRYS